MADGYEITVNVSSDVGCQRTVNEDCVRSVMPHDPGLRRRRGCLVVVADGMGGHAAGEVASRLAVDTIHHAYYGGPDSDLPTLADALHRANQAIYEHARTNARFSGMGTTCTALVLRGDAAECAHVGDTRLYLVRQSRIYRMTEDHSAVRSLVARGLLSAGDAAHHADRNVILRALGTHPTVEVTTWREPFPTRIGDCFVLSSDGLHDVVDDDEIREIVCAGDGVSACERLVGLARSRGGPDNITVAIVRIGPQTTLAPEDARTTRVVQA
ncbi:MAG: protein phosphatase 2C domain-containing protein [Acidobacteriota bacterium]